MSVHSGVPSSSDSIRRSTSTDSASASASAYEGEESQDESSSRSLSEVLKYAYPKPSTLARKRKVHCNSPAGVKRCRGQTMHDPKNISPSDRVKQ